MQVGYVDYSPAEETLLAAYYSDLFVWYDVETVDDELWCMENDYEPMPLMHDTDSM